MFYSSLIKFYQVTYILYELINCECDIGFNSSHSVNNIFNELLIDF
jgi:hypothetical protein